MENPAFRAGFFVSGAGMLPMGKSHDRQQLETGLYGDESLIYFRRNDNPEEEMKAFLSAIIVALVMGIGAYAILEKSQVGAGQKFTSGATRT